ncbi:hypothetical protein NC651_006574 [Populus alba x Populus x berolinensis]|nr:hypothetical protein NC651_006574 [Populus alba x Populus x berolinensis]
MELMTRLCCYIRETCGPRKRIPFPLPIAVDLMLQIARGMEYIHSKKISWVLLGSSHVPPGFYDAALLFGRSMIGP